MYSSQFDGGFSPSQSSQTPDSTYNKNRVAQPVLPLTVKQISDSYGSADNKSGLIIDGVEATNVKLLGLVMNKEEKNTSISFSLDDGTGRIDVIRWVNDAADSNEMASVQSGMYAVVIGSLKEFQGKRQFGAFSVRPVTDYNAVHHHFIQCIHVHMVNTGGKDGSQSEQHKTSGNLLGALNAVKTEQPPVPSQSFTSTSNGGSATDIYKLVLDVFQEPASLASDHGVHVNEVVKRLGLPEKKIKEAIDYHVDIGHIYSTIDDYHYKAT